MRRLITNAAVALCAFMVLLAPALMNGAPIYWHDSLAYLHGGSSALNITTGTETRYSVMERALLPETDRGPQPAPEVTDESSGTESTAGETDYKITMARSPYYSLVLTSLSAAGGPMAPVFAQALLVLATGFFLLRAVFRNQTVRPALYLLAATSLTGAGVFCAMLLPDFLAPLGILATAVLFSFYDRLTRTDKLFWFLLLVASVVSHTSHLAVALLMLLIGVIYGVLRRKGPVLAPLLICMMGVFIGVASISAFSKTVKAVYGYEPRALPMIAASIIVDGTGLDYLRSSCPENGYVYCDHLYTKATTIDQYLWFEDDRIGIYRFADEETRAQLTDQQFDFLIATLRHDFTGQFAASFQRFIAQLSSNSLSHLAYTDRLKDELSTDLPALDRALVMDSAAYRGTFAIAQLGLVGQVLCYGALIMLIVLLVQVHRQNSAHPRSDRDVTRGALVLFTVLVICGIIANAGITGIVSNPQGRYGARVLWLVPALLAIWLGWLHSARAR